MVVRAALGRRLMHRNDVTVANDQLVTEALAAWDAGAAVLALSLREMDAYGSGHRAELSGVVERIRSAGCDAVLSLSLPPCLEHSTLPADASWELGFDLVSFDCRSTGARSDDATWAAALRERAVALVKSGAVVEVQCSDSRDVKSVLELCDDGLLADPLRFQLLIDAQGRDDSPVERLARATASIPRGAVWFASGIGLEQLPANLYALVAGGHLRTGLDDNVWLVEDVPATDEQLVQRLVRIVDEFDRPLATPDEAREILQLSGFDGDVGKGTESRAVGVDESLIPSLG